MDISNNISHYNNYSKCYSASNTSNGNNKAVFKTLDNIKTSSLDNITLSKRISKIGSFGIDKGTASNTTLFVDRKTFDSIVSYSVNNESCKWDELGIDGEKRWVVINGQRFECPLSEAEKEAYKRASMTMMDYLEEAEKEKDSSTHEDSEKFTINSLNNDIITSSNPKIKNLLTNEPVMNMLKEIASQNGGNITLHT